MQGKDAGHEWRRGQGRSKEGTGSSVKVRFEPKKRTTRKCLQRRRERRNKVKERKDTRKGGGGEKEADR